MTTQVIQVTNELDTYKKLIQKGVYQLDQDNIFQIGDEIFTINTAYGHKEIKHISKDKAGGFAVHHISRLFKIVGNIYSGDEREELPNGEHIKHYFQIRLNNDTIEVFNTPPF